MDNNTTNPEEIIVQPEKPAHVLDDELSQRFIRSIHSINKDDNIFESLIDLLASGQPYMVAMNISREVNHMQGKLRFNMTSEKRELMRDSEGNYQEYLNNKLDETFLQMVNTFIITHPILPNMKKSNEKRIIDMIKILYIMLLSNEQFDIIAKLDTPEYIKPCLSEALKFIDSTAESIVDEWYEYLLENENEEIAEKARTIGIDFFNGSKAIDSFDKYFRPYINILKNYGQTYDKYLELRQKYQSITSNLSAKSLYKYFDISDDTFITKRNKYLIPAFQSMFTEEEYVEPIKLLIFGNDYNE